MTIGERIKNRRIELGLSQKELAKKMGYKTPSAICKMETVELNPTTDRVREFAAALETTPEALMGWDVPPDSDQFAHRMYEYWKKLSSMAVKVGQAYDAADDGIKAAVHKLLDIGEDDV